MITRKPLTSTIPIRIKGIHRAVGEDAMKDRPEYPAVNQRIIPMLSTGASITIIRSTTKRVEKRMTHVD